MYRYDYENSKWHVEKHLTTDYITETWEPTKPLVTSAIIMVSYLFAKFHTIQKKKKKSILWMIAFLTCLTVLSHWGSCYTVGIQTISYVSWSICINFCEEAVDVKITHSKSRTYQTAKLLLCDTVVLIDVKQLQKEFTDTTGQSTSFYTYTWTNFDNKSLESNPSICSAADLFLFVK